MKQIIGGKLYNTDTATLVASSTAQDYPPGIAINLYRKTTGEFFVEWADTLIQPLSEAEAKNWVGKYAVDAYTTIFGTVTE